MLSQNQRENLIGLLSFGFFIMLFALFFIVVPGYYGKVADFFGDFELKEVASNLFLPAPESHHPVVYETVMRFSIVFGLFQFFVLALRFYLKSAVGKVAETISNIVLWLGAAYMSNLLFLEQLKWFTFLGGLLAVLGFSIIARSVSLLLFQFRKT